ncbi:MAG TPA: allantoicase [Thermoanaerobaculia bacterium]|jgi:allantoicase|nr:allantoicase [Thermoanaerobaculia bacterium]
MSDFRDLVDLAGERLGGSVLYANDDFFAEKENLIRQAKPVWKEHEYTDRGKWMDGWESRRRRTPGHDFAILRLGARGVVRGVVVDTSFFRGNFPESCSIDGVSVSPLASVEELLGANWKPLLSQTKLQGDSENKFSIDGPYAMTHLRFNIFPDGGVARLRVHGEPVPDWHHHGGLGGEVDLAAVENGGEVLACSDMFFGPKNNLIMPGRALNMSDGWETRRRRGPGHDWVVVKLATEGTLHRIEVDTNHFKGNYPDTASIDGSTDGDTWSDVLPRMKLQAHARHFFVDELTARGPFTHLRLNVFPDGGVSRLRVWGKATGNGRRAAVVRYLNTLADPERDLRSCCGSSKWIEAMAEARPFSDWNKLTAAADRIWSKLGGDDWMEAFRAHPRIGEKKTGARWTADEQSGTRTASSETMDALAQANRDYEQKFGHLYLVCATGRSAEEMLENVRQRMKNDSATELRVAADEQRKIMALRLEKLVL